MLRLRGDAPVPGTHAGGCPLAALDHREQDQVIAQPLAVRRPHPVADVGQGRFLGAVEVVVPCRLDVGVAVLEQALEPGQRFHCLRAVEHAVGRLVVAAVNQISPIALDEGCEAVGVPLALTIVHLEVNGVFHLVQSLQLLQSFAGLLSGPGVLDAGGDAHPSLLQVGFVAPDGQARVERPQRVELAAVGALVNDRGQEVCFQLI